MKIDFKKLTLKGMKKGSRIPTKKEYLNPVRDWLRGLFVASLCLVGGCTYIALDFYGQVHMLSDAVEIDVDVAVYSEREVKQYANIYTEKSSMFEKMREDRKYSAPTVVDSAEEDEVLQNEEENSTLLVE